MSDPSEFGFNPYQASANAVEVTPPPATPEEIRLRKLVDLLALAHAQKKAIDAIVVNLFGSFFLMMQISVVVVDLSPALMRVAGIVMMLVWLMLLVVAIVRLFLYAKIAYGSFWVGSFFALLVLFPCASPFVLLLANQKAIVTLTKAGYFADIMGISHKALQQLESDVAAQQAIVEAIRKETTSMFA